MNEEENLVFPPKSTRHVLPLRVFGPKIDLELLRSSESPETITHQIKEKLKGTDPGEIEYWPEGIRLDRWYSEPVLIFDADDIHRVCENDCQHRRAERRIVSSDAEAVLSSAIRRFALVPTESLTKHEQTNETDAQLIRRSIEKENRWLVPLVVSHQRARFLIVDGMHRLEAARKLGLELVPVIDYDYEREVYLSRWLRVLSGWTSKGFYRRIAKLEKDDNTQLVKLSQHGIAKRGGLLRVLATDVAVLWIEDRNSWTVYAPRTPWTERYTPLQAYRVLLARIDSTFGFDPRTRKSLKGHYVGEDEQPAYLSSKHHIVICPPALTNSQLLESMQEALS
jgi:hypothetical protein